MIFNNIKQLVSIDSEKTHKIIDKYIKNTEIKVIKCLNGYPKLQIEYLENILKTREVGDHIDNDLLKIHINLLCQSRNEKKVNFTLIIIFKN